MGTVNPPRPVQDLLGVGPAIAGQLSMLDVEYDIDLLATTPLHLVENLEQVDGLNSDNILNYYLPQARFCRLSGVSPEIARSIAASYYYMYSEFAFEDTQFLKARIKDAIDQSNNDSSFVTDDKVVGWQFEAALRAKSCVICFIVADPAGQPVQGAKISTVGDGHSNTSHSIERMTDAKGRAYFELLAPVGHSFTVEMAGYKTIVVAAGAPAFETGATVYVDLELGTSTPLVTDEFQGGLVVSGPEDVYTSRMTTLEQLAPCPPFYVEGVDGNDADLVSLWRIKSDNIINSPKVRVPLANLPVGLSAGDVVVQKQGAFQIQEGVTAEEFRAQFVAERYDELYSGG